MKKLIILVMLLTLSLSFTYAQATIGGWGRGIFSPVLTNTTDSWMDLQASWWSNNPRLGFTISGSSDNIGAQIDLTFDGSVGLGDQQKIWAKPIEMLMISIGPSCWDDKLRGNGGFVLNNYLRTAEPLAGDDYTFMHATGNVLVGLDPVDGLHAFAALKGVETAGWYDVAAAPGDTIPLAGDVIATGQYGAGYDIPGVGVAKLQLIGLGMVADKFTGTVNGAFKVTAVENLMAELGVFYGINEVTTDEMAKIALYANYTMDTLVIHFAADVSLPDADKVDSLPNSDATGMPMYFGLGVEYGLEGGLTVQGDVRYGMNGNGGDYANNFAVSAFAKFSYSNGIFGLGLEATNGNFAGNAMLPKVENPDDIVIALPIRLEYWF